MKKGLKKLKPGKDIASGLNALLARYLILPHASTGHSPAKLLFEKNVQSTLDIMRSNTESRKLNVNADKMPTMLHVGERVAARDYVAKSKWLPGRVTSSANKVIYITSQS